LIRRWARNSSRFYFLFSIRFFILFGNSSKATRSLGTYSACFFSSFFSFLSFFASGFFFCSGCYSITYSGTAVAAGWSNLINLGTLGSYFRFSTICFFLESGTTSSLEEYLGAIGAESKLKKKSF